MIRLPVRRFLAARSHRAWFRLTQPFRSTVVADGRGLTLYTRRSPFAMRVRDPLRTWWRQFSVDLFWIANAILALAVGCFIAAILTSAFTIPLKWLWGGIIALCIAVLLHVAGALVQARIEAERVERENMEYRRLLARQSAAEEEEA